MCVYVCMRVAPPLFFLGEKESLFWASSLSPSASTLAPPYLLSLLDKYNPKEKEIPSALLSPTTPSPTTSPTTTNALW